MKSAAARTIPMFPGEPEPKPRKPSVRTLRRRLWQTALAWYRDEAQIIDVFYAASELDEASQE